MNIWLYSVYVLIGVSPIFIATYVYTELKIKYAWFKHTTKSAATILWLRAALDPTTNSQLILKGCEYYPENYAAIYRDIRKYLKVRKISLIYILVYVGWMLLYYFFGKHA